MLLEEGVCYDQCVLLAKSVSFALLHFVLQGQSVSVCIKYNSAIKNNEIMSFAATWMKLEISILIEVSQTKTNIMIYLYMGSKNMIQMNLFTKQK